MCVSGGAEPGAEIDLILRRGERMLGIECKRTDAPRMTSSLRIAAEVPGLERIAVRYSGTRCYPLSDTDEAVPLRELADLC